MAASTHLVPLAHSCRLPDVSTTKKTKGRPGPLIEIQSLSDRITHAEAIENSRFGCTPNLRYGSRQDPRGPRRNLAGPVATQHDFLYLTLTQNCHFVETEEMYIVETDQMFAVETEELSAVEAEHLFSVETGEVSAVETGQISAVETRQMFSVARTDIYLASTHTVQVSEVSTVAMSQCSSRR